jgi:hypothetical protein
LFERLIALGFSDTSPRYGCGTGRKTTRRGSISTRISDLDGSDFVAKFWIVLPLGQRSADRSAETNSTDPPGKGRVKARKGMDHLEEDVKILRDGLRGRNLPA